MYDLKAIYLRMKQQYLLRTGLHVPETYQSAFVCLGGASDVHYTIAASLAPSSKILLIGDFGGRDYFFLDGTGHTVTVFDLDTNPHFKNQVIGNLEEPLPFAANSFDAVILCGVLEHVLRDHDALLNIRAVLNNSGKLILRVPLYDDNEETHVRLYSKKILRRLLASSGYLICSYREYPNLFMIPTLINFPHHFVNLISFLLFRRTIYQYTLPVFWRTEYCLSSKNGFLMRLFRGVAHIIRPCSREAHLVCKKTEKFDYIDSNRLRFKHC